MDAQCVARYSSGPVIPPCAVHGGARCGDTKKHQQGSVADYASAEMNRRSGLVLCREQGVWHNPGLDVPVVPGYVLLGLRMGLYWLPDYEGLRASSLPGSLVAGRSLPIGLSAVVVKFCRAICVAVTVCRRCRMQTVSKPSRVKTGTSRAHTSPNA